MIQYSQEEYYYKLDNMLLSSCQHLRKIFKRRWKSETGEDWVDTVDHLKVFIEGVGKPVYKKAPPAFQKIALKTTLLEEWDLALLSLVIQKLGSEQKYEQENSAIRKLKDLRNKLAHHSSKKIPKDEFEEDAEIFKINLRSLGMKEEDIDILINKAGVTSSLQALELLKELHERAARLFKDDQIDKSVECYSNAIDIPSLQPEHLGNAYEKRAHCYLKLIKDPLIDGDKCDQALLDAEKALELNSDSWMAHFLAARCYRWKNRFAEAIHHFERSLSISPVQKKVRKHFDACKWSAGEYLTLDLDNPAMLPVNLEECMAESERITGVKMSEEEYLFNRSIVEGSLFKGQDLVFLGHQHYFGLKMPRNWPEAFKCYSKAAALKNTEGMYNVVRCYNYGHGVKQNIQEGLRLCRELAEMDKNSPGHVTPLKCNAAVAAAQHELGIMYNGGIGVEKDFGMAAMWFKKAMENGIGTSASNLGAFYLQGYSFPKDEKITELCLKQALVLNTSHAAAGLMRYYLEQMEPEKATHMFRVGREMGHSGLQSMSEEEFLEQAEEVESERLEMEDEIIEFEKAHNLDIKGLTFQQRVKRFSGPAAVNLMDIMGKNLTMYTGEPESWGGKFQCFSSQILSVIAEKAAAGSQTALSVMKTVENCFKLKQILEKEDEEEIENKKWEILNMFYDCVTHEHHLSRLPEKCKQKLITVIAKLFQEQCQEVGEKDEKIRFCFAMQHFNGSFSSDDMFVVELLKEGVRRYPHNSHYYFLLVNVLEGKHKFEEGKSYTEEALRRFPGDIDLLYNRACFLQKTLPFSFENLTNAGNLQDLLMQRPSITDRIEAFNHFIAVAPKDHRKFPEAFYAISNLHLEQHVMCNGFSPAGNELELVKSYFDRGLEAEKDQLPCYLPYGESEVKRWINAVLSLMENTNSTGAQSVLERKEYLKSPVRKGVILLHRENLKETAEAVAEGGQFMKGAWSPNLRQKMTKKMSTMKPITLMEVNPTKNCVYENRILELTIMDDPNLFPPSLHLIAEDDNGDMTRLFIYNVARDKETIDNFRAGCRIAIINPYVRIAVFGETVGIRNDDARCIVHLKKLENMCRFCGEENATRKCSKCKRPYCSRECQKLDWKEFKHKLICSLKY